MEVALSDFASLLTSIAAVISAVSGLVIGVLALTRGSAKEREQAAQYAIDRVLGNDDEDEDDERREAIDQLLEELRKRGDES